MGNYVQGDGPAGGYQGLSFSEWYWTLTKYAMICALEGNRDEAYSTIQAAFDANIFYHDLQIRIRVKLVTLGNKGK